MRWPVLAATLAGVANAAGATAADSVPTVPQFIEETATAGLTTPYAGDWFFMVGGGVAAFDCSEDYLPDLFIPGGEGSAAMYVNESSLGGSLKFLPKTSGLELTGATGAYPADIDGDGAVDLIVLRVGENVAMRGLGECRFERANEAWHFDGGDAWSAAAAVTWEKGNDWPTVAIGNYINRDEDISPWGSCTENWLHRPDNAGPGFSSPLALSPSYCALSMMFTDWNRSGTPSLRIANDREYYEGGQEQLWRLPQAAEPTLYTEQDGWKRLRIWGMGLASVDLNGDSFPEYFITSMADNKLQTLSAPGRNASADYKDVAFPKGVTAPSPHTGGDIRPSTAWHTQFEDVNNDGLWDLFIAKGNVDHMPDFASRDPNNLLLQKVDGSFVESGEASGIADNGVSRGAAMVDLNGDGLLDLVETNRWEAPQVWRNASTGSGHWIGIELRQPGANVDAIGAWLEVTHSGKTTSRELVIGGGHAGGQLGFVHFGLADDIEATVDVTWPDGAKSEWKGLKADRYYRLERDQAAPVAVTLSR